KESCDRYGSNNNNHRGERRESRYFHQGLHVTIADHTLRNNASPRTARLPSKKAQSRSTFKEKVARDVCIKYPSPYCAPSISETTMRLNPNESPNRNVGNNASTMRGSQYERISRSGGRPKLRKFRVSASRGLWITSAHATTTFRP